MEGLKVHIDGSNQKIREEFEERIGKVEKKVKDLNERVNELENERGSESAEADSLKEEVKELTAWKKEIEKRTEEQSKNLKERMEKEGKNKTGQEEEKEEWNRKEIEWIIEEREREKRNRNLIITGLKENEAFKKEEMEKWMKEKIDTEVRIEKIWRIKTNKSSLVGIQCESEEKRGEILRNKKRLGDQKIFIEEDLTWKERRNKEIVREKARELRAQGKEAIIIKNRKVRTEEGTWTWSERKEKWFLNKEQKMRRGN